MNSSDKPTLTAAQLRAGTIAPVIGVVPVVVQIDDGQTVYQYRIVGWRVEYKDNPETNPTEREGKERVPARLVLEAIP